LCSFCPRPYDFGEDAIPAPYNHANVMSDEVIYYASPKFMSRKGIEYGSITLHPDGITHGPHPGRYEASIGAKATDELAVMVDTYYPLKIAKPALEIEDGDYGRSWLSDGEGFEDALGT
jgi:homogentisate 1,2-dioxygenase